MVIQSGPNDWSWRVRYAAIQGLVKICQCSINDSTKEGLRTVAWNTLVNVPSREKDSRVLEALKVGQVSLDNQRHSLKNVWDVHFILG